MTRDEATRILLEPVRKDMDAWKRTVAKARRCATLAHAKQKDKEGKPYIGHLERVFKAVHQECLKNLEWATICAAFRAGDEIAAGFLEHVDKENVAKIHQYATSQNWTSLRDVIRLNANIEAAAWLHDAVEDTPATLKDIRGNFGVMVEDIVRTLTRTKNVPYRDYLEKIRNNPFARMVKLADMRDNADPERIGRLPKEQAERLAKKYRDGMAFLTALDAPGELDIPHVPGM